MLRFLFGSGSLVPSLSRIPSRFNTSQTKMLNTSTVVGNFQRNYFLSTTATTTTVQTKTKIVIPKLCSNQQEIPIYFNGFAQKFNTSSFTNPFGSDSGGFYGSTRSIWSPLGFMLLLLGSYGYLNYLDSNKLNVFADSGPVPKKDESNEIIPGIERDELPTYTLEQVSKHNQKLESVWIVYKAGVYDVTDFVAGHPGGEVILLAAGNSIEPFWEIYGQHKTQQVYEILESYRIGNLRPEDRITPEQLAEQNQFEEFIPVGERSQQKRLIIHHMKPFNAETEPEILPNNFLTPIPNFFVRHHLAVPEVDPEEYLLEIEGFGLGESTCSLTLEQIKTLFPKHSVTSVIQCAGNRRDEFNKIQEVKGIAWGTGAIGNAKWSGVRLMDVLRHCEADLTNSSIKHVQFEGMDLDATGTPYGASVPADKALDPNAEVILAYEMNDELLPCDHGFPIRLIAPGIVGARNVKWLGKIILSDEESHSHWQRNDYKSFPPNVRSATPEQFQLASAIQELPIQSAICTPRSGHTVAVQWKPVNKPDGTTSVEPVIEVTGYAWSGGGRDVIRVDLSLDSGETWTTAQLEQEMPKKPPTHTYSWTLWKADLQLQTGQLFSGNQLEIVCRSFDSSYNTQPATAKEIWNFRGLLNNCWHRISVKIL